MLSDNTKTSLVSENISFFRCQNYFGSETRGSNYKQYLLLICQLNYVYINCILFILQIKNNLLINRINSFDFFSRETGVLFLSSKV